MIYTPELYHRYRDFWGEYLPPLIDQLGPLYDSECHVLRFYNCPQNAQQNIVAPGYLKTTLNFPPGSFIVSIQHDEAAVGTPPFMLQITDVAADYKWFSNPIPDTFLQKNEGIGALLQRPYPIAAPGIIAVEFWNNGTTQNCTLTLGVAELIRS
jgi:hypothetical protein